MPATRRSSSPATRRERVRATSRRRARFCGRSTASPPTPSPTRRRAAMKKKNDSTAPAPAPRKRAKSRLDVALGDSGLVETRTKAQSLIMARRVLVNERFVDKPGVSVIDDDVLRVAEPEHPWVGRGGIKLAHALQQFGIDVRGRTCADIGASTGGFTDVLLQSGARKVYAIDVGYGQLD